MKKILTIFLLTSSIAALLIVGAAYMTQQAKRKAEGAESMIPEQQEWITPAVILPEQIETQALKVLQLKEITNVYNIKYQNAVQDLVDGYKTEKTYSLQEPLLILNPYGTNKTGLYIYFENGQRVNAEYEVSVKDEKIANFHGKLYTNVAGMPLATQEGQIIGLLQGRMNYVIVWLYDQEGKLVGKAGYKIEVPDYGTIKEEVLSMEQIRTDNQMSDGLFCLFGYDRRNDEEPRHMLFYDNKGVIRAEIPWNGSVQDVKISRVGEDIFYACGARKYALVNRLGKVVKIYSLGKKYTSHHDFEVLSTSDKVLVLADQKEKGTKEDIVLSLDLYTGEVEKILDFEKLLPDIRARARITEDCADQKYLDWIHFNTVSAINENDIILSSRETSTIMRVNDVFGKSEIVWFIADESLWDGTAYEKLCLNKVGDFPSQAGQHTTIYLEDSSLEEGQYYLYMFNNNYGVQSTYPEQNYSVIPGIGLLDQDAEYSYYYRYLIDENARTYELVQKIELPYSSIVSGTQHYKGNIVTCSGMAGIFEEYNMDGKCIARYFMDVDLFTYRVLKYDMKGYWFANE